MKTLLITNDGCISKNSPLKIKEEYSANLTEDTLLHAAALLHLTDNDDLLARESIQKMGKDSVWRIHGRSIICTEDYSTVVLLIHIKKEAD